VIAERSADCGALYGQKRRELLALAHALTEDELATPVAATPAWDVHDVLAHLVGIAADLNALRFDDPTPEAWTERQVEERRDRSVRDLEREWDAEAPRFEEGLRLLGYELGSHYVGDLLQHTQDVHAALGRGPIADDEALAVALDYYVDHLSHTLAAAGVGSVEVRVGDEAWTAGAGPVVATVAAGRLDLFRALGGRRSEAGVRALRWSGDVDLVLPHLSAYPMPTEDAEPPEPGPGPGVSRSWPGGAGPPGRRTS
jgi:uncharacterized protein (TIGR03083 family)